VRRGTSPQQPVAEDGQLASEGHNRLYAGALCIDPV